ncbi:hypothetical protein DFH08DRAFT_1077122 [Mycena albidolilacea]|uniref:Uncharacterized protein n=1 Tax=Mycena albidolilacea TaxID=1033008 RepID=A0AAD7ABM9_9AGAR|nr:hypothetical protein DFH08DRAFT_1077122 [Mycena albidolilacea]
MVDNNSKERNGYAKSPRTKQDANASKKASPNIVASHTPPTDSAGRFEAWGTARAIAALNLAPPLDDEHNGIGSPCSSSFPPQDSRRARGVTPSLWPEDLAAPSTPRAGAGRRDRGAAIPLRPRQARIRIVDGGGFTTILTTILIAGNIARLSFRLTSALRVQD